MMKLFAIAICFAIASQCDAKRGGSGGFSRGGGGSSRGGGWSFGGSKPSPSYSRPSPSYSAPSPSYSYPSPSYSAPSYKPAAPAPSYGWNLPSPSGSSFNTPAKSPSYGWNLGNTNSAPKPSAPVAPPAYPGLQNRPVSNSYNPPAYSPSFSNPPAYSPSNNFKPSPSWGSNPSPSFNSQPSSSWNSKPATSWNSQPSPSWNSRPSSSYNTHNSPSYNTHHSPSYNTHHSPSFSNNYSPNYASRPGLGGGYYGSNNYNNHNNYGSTFGSGGLPGNTYISNNYYGNSRSGGSGFLSNALSFGAGTGMGYMWGNRNSYRDGYGSRRRWDEEEDRKWRATTKAPYFENKVPGSEVILPAAAVVGAATAFGLVSLLPLNVPINKPLMYCDQNSSDVAQVKILLNGIVYECVNETILMTDINCPKPMAVNETQFNVTTELPLNVESTTVVESSNNETNINANSCDEKTLQCDSDDKIHCINATLFSRANIFCNSTALLNGTSNINETFIILNCYEGQLSEKQAAFIPTTTTTTEAPPATTEKSLSWGAKIHVFILKMIGKGDSVKKTETTTTELPDEIPIMSADESLPVWVPEALTIPPETTTTTEAPKMIWMEKTYDLNDSDNVKEVLRPVSAEKQATLNAAYEKNNEDSLFMFYTKVLSTTEAPENSTTTTTISS